MTLEILSRPLSYVDQLESRSTDCINLVVIHCTELPDLDTARIYGKKEMHVTSHTGNSGHFLNSKSIGIELVNNGRYPNWFHSGHQQMTETYPPAQIQALISLLNDLTERLPGLTQIAGHEALDTELIAADDNPDIMINRKLDPGVHFPWKDVLSAISLVQYQVKN